MQFQLHQEKQNFLDLYLLYCQDDCQLHLQIILLIQERYCQVQLLFFVFIDLSSVLLYRCFFYCKFFYVNFFLNFYYTRVVFKLFNYLLYTINVIFLKIIKEANVWRDPCHVFYNIYVMKIEHFFEIYFIINKLIVLFD